MKDETYLRHRPESLDKQEIRVMFHLCNWNYFFPVEVKLYTEFRWLLKRRILHQLVTFSVCDLFDVLTVCRILMNGRIFFLSHCIYLLYDTFSCRENQTDLHLQTTQGGKYVSIDELYPLTNLTRNETETELALYL